MEAEGRRSTCAAGKGQEAENKVWKQKGSVVWAERRVDNRDVDTELGEMKMGRAVSVEHSDVDHSELGEMKLGEQQDPASLTGKVGNTLGEGQRSAGGCSTPSQAQRRLTQLPRQVGASPGTPTALSGQ